MKVDPQRCRFATHAVHVGHDPSDRPEDRTGALTVPIYQTSTYLQAEIGPDPQYEYARVQNPTRTAFEKNVATLERGRSGHGFASGMAAISTVMSLLNPGDEVVVSRDVYGGTNRYLKQVLARYDVRSHWVDTTDLDAVEQALATKPNVRMVFIETPSNPMMEVTDIRGVAEVARRHQALVAVDNTFLSPRLQLPLELGADIVVHSTTKFLNGHSDSLGGAVVIAEENDPATLAALRGLHEGDLSAHMAYMQKCSGGVLAPFECFLILRGIRTLAVRMDRHEQNGRQLANFLDGQRQRGRIQKLLYPGLPDHPGHQIQERQASGYGSMISFDIGDPAAAKTFLESLEIFSLAESLGGVESLACLPCAMTHASVAPEERQMLGITDGLVRLSVGIECYDDLEQDVAQALDRALG